MLRSVFVGVKEGPQSPLLMLKRAELLLCQQGGRRGVSIGVHGPRQQLAAHYRTCYSLSLSLSLLAFAYVE
jgi:hypothetical protein